ncbi:NAD-dependent dehydratase [Neorhizobium sp. JUb45]|uniref:NAD-dependent dehydratase n=1 Tax=unclassified Neorhizobium TaxID=2629175 RepID=UPI00104618F2|nr:NAD-dependent dehydratase [Neorhizobium sp. JUb45]
MKLLLVGASGLVGSHVLKLALADPRVTHVVAPGRKALAAHAKLEAPICDFSGMTGDEPFWQGGAVICTLGTTIKVAGSQAAFERVDHDYPLTVARLMHKRGAQVYVLNSAIGADANSRFFYNRVKGRLEQDLAAIGFRSLAFVRPGLIGGERAERRRGEGIAEAVLKIAAPVLPKRWRINPAPVIAQSLLDCALAAKPGIRIVPSEELTGQV